MPACCAFHIVVCNVYNKAARRHIFLETDHSRLQIAEIEISLRDVHNIIIIITAVTVAVKL